MGAAWDTLSVWQVGAVWVPKSKSHHGGGTGPSPAHQSDRERCQDDLSPSPARWERLVMERNRVCFSPRVPRLTLEKTNFSWLAWLHFKYLTLASFALHGTSFRFLPLTRAVCLHQGWAAGGDSIIYFCVNDVDIQSLVVTAFLINRVSVPRGGLPCAIYAQMPLSFQSLVKTL